MGLIDDQVYICSDGNFPVTRISIIRKTHVILLTKFKTSE